MAKAGDIGNASSDLTNNLQRDFNLFIQAALLDLSSEEDPISPIDTGFFASSWTASTQRPRPDQAREDHPPWSKIEPSYEGKPAPASFVEPRFINNIKFNFKPFSKVFIGNRSEYAASALGSRRSKIVKYVGTLGQLINATFTDKKPSIAVASRKFQGGSISPTGTKGIGQFADPDREFVDYTNL